MNKHLLKTLAISCMILLEACVSAKITSNKQEGYNKKPKKIYVLLNASKEAKSFSKEFSKDVKDLLTKNHVESEVYERNELTLDSDGDVNRNINNYDPDAVLVIKQTLVHSTNGRVDGGSFEITLIDAETRKPVWKSEFEVFGSLGLSEAAATGANKLCDKLIEDKII